MGGDGAEETGGVFCLMLCEFAICRLRCVLLRLEVQRTLIWLWVREGELRSGRSNEQPASQPAYPTCHERITSLHCVWSSFESVNTPLWSRR